MDARHVDETPFVSKGYDSAWITRTTRPSRSGAAFSQVPGGSRTGSRPSTQADAMESAIPVHLRTERIRDRCTDDAYLPPAPAFATRFTCQPVIRPLEQLARVKATRRPRANFRTSENVSQKAIRLAPRVPSTANSVAHEGPQQLECHGDRMDVRRTGLGDFGEGVLDPCELLLVCAFPLHDPFRGVGPLGTAAACCPQN